MCTQQNNLHSVDQLQNTKVVGPDCNFKYDVYKINVAVGANHLNHHPTLHRFGQFLQTKFREEYYVAQGQPRVLLHCPDSRPAVASRGACGASPLHV
jgi:hypothetical protein